MALSVGWMGTTRANRSPIAGKWQITRPESFWGRDNTNQMFAKLRIVPQVQWPKNFFRYLVFQTFSSRIRHWAAFTELAAWYRLPNLDIGNKGRCTTDANRECMLALMQQTINCQSTPSKSCGRCWWSKSFLRPITRFERTFFRFSQYLFSVSHTGSKQPCLCSHRSLDPIYRLREPINRKPRFNPRKKNQWQHDGPRVRRNDIPIPETDV